MSEIEEKFIKKANKIHNSKYDYSLISYLNSKSKIKIICKEHGIFEQIPNSHLIGYGCVKCGSKSAKDKIKININDFIKKFIVIHNDKYDYSLVSYLNSKSKIKIICKEHGIFEQLTNHHLSGKGCPKCVGRNLTNDDFIKKCKDIHGDKYDYTLVNFTKSQNYIDIICKEHGHFRQKASNHINQKQNCPKCMGRNLTNNDFIEKCKEIHCDIYDYSKTEYNGSEKIIIICKEHGSFKQTPSHHLSGQGCVKCKSSKGEKTIINILNNIKIDFKYQHKFSDLSNHKFDFYLPTSNLCIEYDGVQHFKPVKYFGGVLAFENQKIRDDIKNEYCIKKNINILRIPYTESEYNINKMILDIINKNCQN